MSRTPPLAILALAVTSVFGAVSFAMAEDSVSSPGRSVLDQPAEFPGVPDSDSTSASAPPEEEPFVSGLLNLDYYTDYIYRGQSFFNGPSIQPSADLIWNLGDYGHLTTGTFFHFSVQTNDTNGFMEFDQSIAWDNTFDIATVSLGYGRYTFPRNNVGFITFGDIFASISLDMPLRPAVTIFHEVINYRYTYYEPSLTHIIPLDDCLELSVYGSLGLASNAERYYADNGLQAINMGVSLGYTAGDWRFAPTVNYMIGPKRDTIDVLWGGVSMSRSF